MIISLTSWYRNLHSPRSKEELNHRLLDLKKKNNIDESSYRIEISDDEVLVSFDVVSLSTAIPVEKACEYIRKKLNEDTTLHLRTNLTSEEIISLLDFQYQTTTSYTMILFTNRYTVVR